jgi:predicted lipoprotein with Yx(FWY)xxD motif
MPQAQAHRRTSWSRTWSLSPDEAAADMKTRRRAPTGENIAMTREQFAGSGMRGATGWRGVLRHRFLCLSCLGTVALVATACSSGGSTASSTAPTSSTLGSTGTSAVIKVPESTTAVIKVLTVPTYGPILTDSSGKPLYTLSGSCTGSCASAWPALTVPAGTKPNGGAGVTGTLSTVKQADGTYQVMYNGSPLYTFVQDSSGHVTGQGVAGFSVVRASGSANPTGSTTSTTSHSGY